jgi:thiamine monophosphate synthase
MHSACPDYVALGPIYPTAESDAWQLKVSPVSANGAKDPPS